jgi:uroporphyrinogen decarboxylase
MKKTLDRRSFINAVGAVSVPLISGCRAPQTSREPVTIDKRKAMLSLLDGSNRPTYTPAAFFLHFDEIYHRGPGAIEKHLEYFRYTDMDFVKIQYELTFPHRPEIQTPADWEKMPLYREDFYEPQLKVVEGLVKAAKKEALVLVTLYSPFMCAGHTTSDQIIAKHMLESPEKVKKGMEVITESVALFVRGCIKAGVDGFYASTQGGENNRFEDSGPFLECIKPYDLMIMEEINQSCIFNILHVCDYSGPYDDLTPFLDYPGDVVNCSLRVGSEEITSKEASEMFSRPYMGGMERQGLIVSGSKTEIKGAVEDILRKAPEQFILGADCTVPSEIDWDNVRTAVSTAHSFRSS